MLRGIKVPFVWSLGFFENIKIEPKSLKNLKIRIFKKNRSEDISMKAIIYTILVVAFLSLFGCTESRVDPINEPESNNEIVTTTDIKSEATQTEPPTAESTNTKQDFFD